MRTTRCNDNDWLLFLRVPAAVAGQSLAQFTFPPDGLSVASTRESEFSLIINGRLHIDYWGFAQANDGVDAIEGTKPQDRVGFRRIRVSAKGTVRKHIIYKIEIEFANPDDTEWRDASSAFEIFRGCKKSSSATKSIPMASTT